MKRRHDQQQGEDHQAKKGARAQAIRPEKVVAEPTVKKRQRKGLRMMEPEEQSRSGENPVVQA